MILIIGEVKCYGVYYACIIVYPFYICIILISICIINLFFLFPTFIKMQIYI